MELGRAMSKPRRRTAPQASSSWLGEKYLCLAICGGISCGKTWVFFTDALAELPNLQRSTVGVRWTNSWIVRRRCKWDPKLWHQQICFKKQRRRLWALQKAPYHPSILLIIITIIIITIIIIISITAFTHDVGCNHLHQHHNSLVCRQRQLPASSQQCSRASTQRDGEKGSTG